MTNSKESISDNDLEIDLRVERSYTKESISVNDLEIDRRVQRQGLNRHKVQQIVKNFNSDALGVCSVSRRSNKAQILIDGQHRWEAVRIITDTNGYLDCHVFEGLSLAEEAQMFIDLNKTTVPPVIDRFNVTQNIEGPEGDKARDIAELARAYGWTISRTPGNGHINAIQVVSRLYDLSRVKNAEPNLVQAAILVITQAWGNDRFGAQGPILEAVGRMFAEYGSLLQVDRLIDVMKMYKGGPRSLLAEAAQLAAIRKGKVSMAVAEILVEQYNRGRRTSLLSQWRQRS